MWANGTVVDLGPGRAIAINDSNHVVGFSIDDTGLIVTAHLWFNGLDTAIGSWLPQGINNLGLVVGSPLNFGPAQQWDASCTDSSSPCYGQKDIPECQVALGSQ